VLPTYLTVEELAVILKVSVARAYQLCRENVIPHTRLGRQIRINPENLKSFCDSGGKSLPGGWRREATT
jgi:excisionase family DNA binding protein